MANSMTEPSPAARSGRDATGIDWARVFCAYGWVYLAVILIGGMDIARHLTNVGYLPFNFGFTWCLWHFGHAARDHPWLVRSFNAGAVSFLLVGAGNTAVFLMGGSYPSAFSMDVASWFYLASYVPFMVWLRGMSAGILPEVSWRGSAHDRIVLAVGVGILTWFLIAAPLLRLAQSPAERFLSVIFPVAVLLNFLFLIPLVLKAMLPHTGRGARRLAIGLSIYLAMDLFYQVMPLLHGSFLGLEPFAWGDIVYILAYLLLFTGVRGVSQDVAQPSRATARQIESAHAASAIALFMMAAVYVVLWRAALIGNWNDLTAIAIAWGVITILVIIHGVISVRENRRLIEERAQREADEKLWAAFREIHVGITLVDPDMTVRFSNPAMRELLGIPDSAPQGRSILDPRWKAQREDGSPLPPEETPSAVAARTGKPQRNVVVSVERRNDGKRIWLLSNAVPRRRGRRC
jgi:PAS domain-containing protein